MSAVTLLCADHSLPLYRSGSRRIRTAPSGPVAGDGFSVQTHKYYRQVVEELGLTMKPFQYELDLRATGEDAAQLPIWKRTSAPARQRSCGTCGWETARPGPSVSPDRWPLWNRTP